MKVLLIDNYDSFTYNIVELLRQLGVSDLTMLKNDEVSVDQATLFDRIILSPGPATPAESGNLLNIIQALSPTRSILGICLGHQAIAQSFGATLRNEKIPFHGFKSSLFIKRKHSIFEGMDMNQDVDKHNQSSSIQYSELPSIGLYHSWTVNETDFPDCLEITSYSKEGNIMSIRHRTYDVHGLQFHPESYMTDFGKLMMGNFLFKTGE